jgi:para-aminobenzoate synthetase/4-amino-4-deoxychorismate lyase
MDILARPMKGTARRGRTLEEDRALGASLAASAKERAENVMVVDMIRNDLGRVAEVGTVEVPELFTVERYPNVWQMTSLVKATSVAPLDEIFAALHPSASVTGAPKVRTMELLAGLEGSPRGVYTGAVGHIPPDGLARFNVAIRTAVVDRRRQSLAFGIGSGIVWDSSADGEYAECLLKASVLGARPPAFELLETLLWSPGEGYALLDRHLQRLQASAEYFLRPVSLPDVQAALIAVVAAETEPMRVRLLVAEGGRITTEATPHVPTPVPLRVAVAPEPIDSTDVFLFHKTTHRRVYEQARSSVEGVDEVLLWNTAGELTEATTANVIVEADGVRVTPPVECGLLGGTYRARMLEAGEVSVQRVGVASLRPATRLWLVNSVHGVREAVLVSD